MFLSVFYEKSSQSVVFDKNRLIYIFYSLPLFQAKIACRIEESRGIIKEKAYLGKRLDGRDIDEKIFGKRQKIDC